jgi:hypothetical protein
MIFAGNWHIPFAVGLVAFAIIIAWHYRSARGLVAVTACAALSLPALVQAVSTEIPLFDQLALFGLLTPGFTLCLAFALCVFLFAPQTFSSRRFISTVALIGLVNCSWLAYLDWTLANFEHSMEPTLSKLLCNKKQATTSTWFRCYAACQKACG